MALAIECDRLIRGGVIKNQSKLAHYANITTARMTHIMWPTNLAPEIQEAIDTPLVTLPAFGLLMLLDNKVDCLVSMLCFQF